MAFSFCGWVVLPSVGLYRAIGAYFKSWWVLLFVVDNSVYWEGGIFFLYLGRWVSVHRWRCGGGNPFIFVWFLSLFNKPFNKFILYIRERPYKHTKKKRKRWSASKALKLFLILFFIILYYSYTQKV